MKKEYEKYIKYVYCEEDSINKLKTIAIIEEFTPENIIKKIKKDYDEVHYKEIS